MQYATEYLHLFRAVEIWLGVIFAWAGLMKLLYPTAPRDWVGRLVQVRLPYAKAIVIMVAMLEIVAGSALTAAIGRPAPAIALAVLLLVFSSALLFSSDPHGACGCFGPLGKQGTRSVIMIRNVVLLVGSLVAVWGGLGPSDEQLVWNSGSVVLAALTLGSSVALYVTMSSLSSLDAHEHSSNAKTRR